MHVTIHPDSPIPIHDQLVTQISLLIAAGILPPGARLPSVRALSMRLGVHRNTVQAAYKAMADLGLVVPQVGSGVRVADTSAPRPLTAWSEGVALRHLVGQFLSDARRHGFDDQAILDTVSSALRPPDVRRIVVVDPHADVHPLYRQELTPWFTCSLDVMTFDQVAAQQDTLGDAVLLTSAYHAVILRQTVGERFPLVVMTVNAAEAVLDRVRQLPPGAMLGMVSVSATLLRMAGEVLASLQRDDLDLVPITADNATGIRTVATRADLVLVDSVCAAVVTAQATKPVQVFPLIPGTSIQALMQHLPPETRQRSRL
jgi:DNA-binding transcriptional regulator YhcF (GntR family)